MRRNVTEQVQRMGRESVVSRRGFDREVGEPSRLVEAAKQQTGAPQRVVVPAELADLTPCRLTLDELLAFLEAVQRPARLAELRQHPGGGGGDRGGKLEADPPSPTPTGWDRGCHPDTLRWPHRLSTPRAPPLR